MISLRTSPLTKLSSNWTIPQTPLLSEFWLRLCMRRAWHQRKADRGLRLDSLLPCTCQWGKSGGANLPTCGALGRSCRKRKSISARGSGRALGLSLSTRMWGRGSTVIVREPPGLKMPSSSSLILLEPSPEATRTGHLGGGSHGEEPRGPAAQHVGGVPAAGPPANVAV